MVVALEGDRFALELLRQGPGGMAFLLDDRIGDLDVVTTAIEQARRGQVSLDSGASERPQCGEPMARAARHRGRQEREAQHRSPSGALRRSRSRKQ